MHGTLVLLMIFLIWQAVDRRRHDGPLLPWLHRTRRPKQEQTRWDSLPPVTYARRDRVMPPIRERIDSCWQDEEAYLREEQRGWEHPGDMGKLLMLLYTPGRMYRAAIFGEQRRFQVLYDTLLLYDEEEVCWSHMEGSPYGEWAWDRGEHWYDDFAAAEEAARAVLSQLEAAEREALRAADQPG